MKHQKSGRKLGRKRNQKKALLRSLAVNIVRDGKIKTTEAKAKEMRPYLEKLVSKARTDNLANRRLIISKVGNESAKKLFDTIAPKYEKRSGGYVRIIKLPPRRGDASKMAIIEFV